MQLTKRVWSQLYKFRYAVLFVLAITLILILSAYFGRSIFMKADTAYVPTAHVADPKQSAAYQLADPAQSTTLADSTTTKEAPSPVASPSSPVVESPVLSCEEQKRQTLEAQRTRSIAEQQREYDEEVFELRQKYPVTKYSSFLQYRLDEQADDLSQELRSINRKFDYLVARTSC